MVEEVIKRDGRLVPYNVEKIEQAVLKCYNEVYKGEKDNIDYAKIVTDLVEQKIKRYPKSTIEIEEIQDMVVETLMGFDDIIGKAYQSYREARTSLRGNTIDKELNELLIGESEYWNNENSNKNSILITTQRDYMAGIVSKDLARRKLIPEDVIQAHEAGVIHWHDMDYTAQKSTNCELCNLEDCLNNGTVINGKMIEKPNRFLTAMTIATQIILATTSSTYGGCSVTLTHLAPFVRSSKNKFIAKYKKFNYLTDEQISELVMVDLKKEIEDGVQTFNYQLNSFTNSNGQAPFVTVFCYLSENPEYKEEVALITAELFKQRILGIKNEKGVYVTQAFPKIIYVLEEDNVKEDSKYWWLTKLGAECTSKRLVPDYISEKKMKEFKEGNCFPPMGCRSMLSPWKDENGNYKWYGRNNLGVVTLSLPHVALSSGGNMDLFWKLLQERTELCHKALLTRYNLLKGTYSDVAPTFWQHGVIARLKKGEKIDKLLKGGYATISLGYAGLYECVKYMTGESHIGTQKGKEFGLQVMKFLNLKCDEWKLMDDLGYGLYGTPLESTTYKFAKCLQDQFGIIEGITDRDYITNSYHAPVFQEINAFDKLKYESEFQELSLGGAISYVEAGDLTQNIEAILEVIKYIYETCIYAEINIKSDYCMKCGFDGEMKLDKDLNWYCPNCGNSDKNELYVTRRTCGYCGTNFWNKGRTQEISQRFVHLGEIEMEE